MRYYDLTQDDDDAPGAQDILDELARINEQLSTLNALILPLLFAVKAE